MDLEKERELRFRFVCTFKGAEEKILTFECDSRESRDVCFEGLRDFISVIRDDGIAEPLGVDQYLSVASWRHLSILYLILTQCVGWSGATIPQEENW